MTRSTGKRKHHFKNTLPKDSTITPFAEWKTPNRSFHHAFYHWLKSGGYSSSALSTYSVAARLALGYLNKLHWKIDPEADFELVRRYIEKHYTSLSTRDEYNKGLRKLAEYMNFRQNKAARPKNIHWEYYLKGLPEWLCEHVHDFIAHKQKRWRVEDRHRCTMETLSPLCQILRWMAQSIMLKDIDEITPQLWFEYMDERIQNRISLNTIKSQLTCLRAFLLFLNEQGVSICQRTLLVDALKTGPRIPKDAPVSQLKILLQGIEREAQAEHASLRRMGALDRAWVYLMLYSGLRTCEVRHLLISDVDWENRCIRIEQSKGLKDRMVYMNSITVQAINTWLEARGRPEPFMDHIFLYRHQPLSRRYCG
jgi:site-specific recombinase XerD